MSCFTVFYVCYCRSIHHLDRRDVVLSPPQDGGLGHRAARAVAVMEKAPYQPPAAAGVLEAAIATLQSGAGALNSRAALPLIRRPRLALPGLRLSVDAAPLLPPAYPAVQPDHYT